MDLKSVLIFIFISHLIWAYCAFGNEPILVLRSKGEQFKEAALSLHDEISVDYSIQELVLNETMTVNTFTHIVKQISPKLIVLIDNRAINFYKHYYQTLNKTHKPIPSLSLMSVFVEKSIEGLENAGAISYEVPLATAVKSLGKILESSITKVGVIYREFMFDYIKANREICTKDNIEIVERVIWKENKDYKAALRKRIRELMVREKVDAIWIMNDNALLKPRIIRDIWVPLLNKYKKPAIVGVKALVTPKLNFGTFAVLPDHRSLGMQAAEIIFMASENNWKIEQRVAPPLAIFKILNIKQLNAFYKGKKFRLGNVDLILE